MPVTISISSIASVELGTAVAPEPAAPALRTAPPAPAPTVRVTVPDGTTVAVRMIDNIDSKRTAPGERFRCSVDDPIVVNNSVAVPRDAGCTAQIITVEESDELALKLYDITINGRSYDTVTEYAQVEAKGKSKGRRALRRGVALGALGAAIGAAAKGKQLVIPAETRLQFELRVPLPLG